MFRRPLLPCACFVVALGLVTVALPTLGWGQDRTTEERLDRLERDLNMLLRQVYRGAPPPPVGADASAGVNVEIRMERLEDRMRDLTGRVEELMNQVNQVRQRVEQINSDVEVRFNQVAGGAGPASPGASQHAALPDGDALTPASAPRQPGPPGAADFGTLTPPGTPPAELTSAPAAAPPREPHAELPGGSAAAQYNYAFGLLKKADYPAAESALKQFVERHPKSALAASAQYWLGETYYARRRYMEAAAAFAEGYKRYPKGSKAPDDLLKLGMSLARADQKKNACVAFGQLDREFPNAAASVHTRAAAEKRRLGC